MEDGDGIIIPLLSQRRSKTTMAAIQSKDEPKQRN